MQTKVSLVVYALAVLASAQNNPAPTDSAQVDPSGSGIDINSLQGPLQTSLKNYIATATANPSFAAAASYFSSVIYASGTSSEAIASQEFSFAANAATGTAFELPAFVTGLPSSVQAPLSTYFEGLYTIIGQGASSVSSAINTMGGGASSSGMAASTGLGASSGLVAPSGVAAASGSQMSGNSTNGSSTSSGGAGTTSNTATASQQTIVVTSSSASTSASTSAKPSNGATGRDSEALMVVGAAVAAILGFVALL